MLAIANSGQPPTTDGHCKFYLPGVSCDQNGNVWTVHNWDEAHHDVTQWSASAGQALFHTREVSSYILEWIVVEPDASFAYVSGYVNCNPYSDSARTSMTFAIQKLNLTTKTVQTIAIPYNNVTVPFTGGSSVFDQQIQLIPLNGLALKGTSLYVTDSAGSQILIYNTSTFALSQTIASVTLPNGIAVDGSSNIWVGNQHTQVSVYNAAGTLLATPITGLADVWSLSISGNTLYVADQGAYQVKVYTLSGSTATLVATYGHKAVAGENAPLAFGQLRSITSDSNGNFIVTQFVANEMGSRMVKFNSSGQFVWEAYCYEFSGCLTHSKANPDVLFGNGRNTYRLDRPNNAATWTGSGITDYGNYFGTSDNARVSPWVFAGAQYPSGGKSKCLTFQGNDFLYYFSTALDIAIYRVVNTGQAGPALQLCSVLGESHPGADGTQWTSVANYPWLWSWYDPSGQGLTSVDTTTNISSTPTTTVNESPANSGQWNWYANGSCVDAQGTIWIATYQRLMAGVHTFSEIWAVPLHGFGPTGNPIYYWNDAVKVLATPKLMADAGIVGSPNGSYVISIDHDSDTDRLYLTLANPAGVTRNGSANYNAIMAYTGVSGLHLGLITNPPAYLINLPTEGCGISVIPDGSGHVAIGMGLGYNGTGAVVHLDHNGNQINLYQPGPNYLSLPFGEPTGAFDNPASLNADLAADGSIDIFQEDDFNGRVFWYNIPASRNTRYTGGKGFRDRRKDQINGY